MLKRLRVLLVAMLAIPLMIFGTAFAPPPTAAKDQIEKLALFITNVKCDRELNKALEIELTLENLSNMTIKVEQWVLEREAYDKTRLWLVNSDAAFLPKPNWPAAQLVPREKYLTVEPNDRIKKRIVFPLEGAQFSKYEPLKSSVEVSREPKLPAGTFAIDMVLCLDLRLEEFRGIGPQPLRNSDQPRLPATERAIIPSKNKQWLTVPAK